MVTLNLSVPFDRAYITLCAYQLRKFIIKIFFSVVGDFSSSNIMVCSSWLNSLNSLLGTGPDPGRFWHRYTDFGDIKFGRPQNKSRTKTKKISQFITESKISKVRELIPTITRQCAQCSQDLMIDSQHLWKYAPKVSKVWELIHGTWECACKVYKVRKVICGTCGIVRAKFYKSVKWFVALTGSCVQSFTSP